MTGKKITLSAAMRARDVSRPHPEFPEDAAQSTEPASDAAASAPYDGEHATRSERQRAQLRAILGGAGMVAVGTPEAEREGSSQAQPDGTVPSPSGQGVRGIGVYPPGKSVYPPENRRTRHRKRRAD
jgi:hypothetical protein